MKSSQWMTSKKPCRPLSNRAIKGTFFSLAALSSPGRATPSRHDDPATCSRRRASGETRHPHRRLQRLAEPLEHAAAGAEKVRGAGFRELPSPSEVADFHPSSTQANSVLHTVGIRELTPRLLHEELCSCPDCGGRRQSADPAGSSAAGTVVAAAASSLSISQPP